MHKIKTFDQINSEIKSEQSNAKKEVKKFLLENQDEIINDLEDKIKINLIKKSNNLPLTDLGERLTNKFEEAESNQTAADIFTNHQVVASEVGKFLAKILKKGQYKINFHSDSYYPTIKYPIFMVSIPSKPKQFDNK